VIGEIVAVIADVGNGIRVVVGVASGRSHWGGGVGWRARVGLGARNGRSCRKAGDGRCGGTYRVCWTTTDPDGGKSQVCAGQVP
jgi:hypothetical protein